MTTMEENHSVPGESEPAQAGAERPVRRWFASILIAAALVGLDQVTKNIAESVLTPGNPIPFVGSLVQWHLLYNSGAAFSLGTSATPVFTVLSSVAVIVLVWVLRTPRPAVLRVAFTLLLGGAAGNLTDRLVRAPGFGTGHVVDFIAFPNFPVFNVADMCITFAGALLVASAIWPEKLGVAAPGEGSATISPSTDRGLQHD